jgi:hypothetical protein
MHDAIILLPAIATPAGCGFFVIHAPVAAGFCRVCFPD